MAPGLRLKYDRARTSPAKFPFHYSSVQALFHVNQISRKHEGEQYCENRYEVEKKTGGFELSLIQQLAGFAIAHESGDDHRHPAENRDHAHPDRKAGRLRWMSLQLSELA